MLSSLVAWFFYPPRPRRTVRRGSASPVIVEALARLAAEVAGRHVVAQQRARPILVLAEARVQALEDRQTGIEPDQVGERERAHRLVGAELHAAVDARHPGQRLARARSR